MDTFLFSLFLLRNTHVVCPLSSVHISSATNSGDRILHMSPNGVLQSIELFQSPTAHSRGMEGSLSFNQDGDADAHAKKFRIGCRDAKEELSRADKHRLKGNATAVDTLESESNPL